MGQSFSNSNLAGILARDMYAGTYYDRTADDEGDVPEPEDWTAVACPVIIGRDQVERVAALRASRNPRKTAPHISAGTTMLLGSPGAECPAAHAARPCDHEKAASITITSAAAE